MTNKAVVVISGGLDSTTLAYQLWHEGYEVHGISFNYGQQHKKELAFAAATCAKLDGSHLVIDLSDLKSAFVDSGSALVTDTDVPEGHYGEESMKATVVPNRNMIMMSIAAGYAVSIGAEQVSMGMHAGDHFIYPDCRPEFFYQATSAILLGNEGFTVPNFRVTAPYIRVTKNDIALKAVQMSVPLHETWSCYKGGDTHCGKCGTCVERLEAIDWALTQYNGMQELAGNEARATDQTEYEDNTYWREALKRETV